MSFVNRISELALLERALSSDRAEMLVLYGRRRVGKTELLRKFSTDTPCLFFSADLSTEADQLRQFSERIHRHTDDPALAGERFTRWESLLEYLFRRAQQDALLVVIDEFPYLCNSNKALPSILQRLWDEYHQTTRLKLILCGSTLSFMEKEVLGHKSPLYGRRTGQIELGPLPVDELVHFFPDHDAAQRIATYGVVGGVPAYLRLLDPRASLGENIRAQILSKGTYLYEEVRFLLMEELREPTRYFSICRAIAHGNSRITEIAAETGLDRPMISKYLATLRELRIVRRDVPVTEVDAASSRRGLYRFEDPFFRFWFRYVFSYKSFLDRGEVDLVHDRFLAPTLDAFLEEPFRTVAKSWLTRRNDAGELPLLAHRFGSWWLRSSRIGLVGLDDQRQALAVDTRWEDAPYSAARLSAFLETVAEFSAYYELSRVHTALITRRAPTPAARAMAQECDCRIWTLADLTPAPQQALAEP